MCGFDSGYGMDARKLDHRVGRRQCERAVCVIKYESSLLERKFDHRVRRGVLRLTNPSRNT
jgi:hypothetical protein